MKTGILKVSMLVFAVTFLISCKDGSGNQSVEVNTPEEVKNEQGKTADVADQVFIDGMTGKIWHNYLEIKMALVNDDASTAKDIAGDMAKSFSKEMAAMKEIALRIAESEDIEVQREAFAEFTEKAGPMFEEGISKGTIYKKFCPMAFDNKGAYWYEDVEEITNPYFGDKMLNCGNIEKTIKK